jgi:serine/arginine repetitive matrix protein 2
VRHSHSPHSIATEALELNELAAKPLLQAAPPPRSENYPQITERRRRAHSPADLPPRPQAVNHIIEERPAAPSPPVAKARLRNLAAFDSEDDSDSALIRPRRQFRGGEDFPRDSPRGPLLGYPPQPTHHRSVFASRVPVEPSYSDPPPQPPGYHPRNYAPAAPPYYQNHSYGMSQPGYPPPNPYGASSHSSSSPYTEPWNYPGYPRGSPPQRHDTLVTRDYPMGLGPLGTGPAIEDGSGDVFSRIAQTIPDLHVLLARYKETHTQLSVREELLRRAGIEQEEKLRAKDDEIAELNEKTRDLESKYATETDRLRSQVGGLEEQTERLKRQAEESRSASNAAMQSWEAKFKELEDAHATLQKNTADEQARAWKEFDEWKSTTTTRNDAEKIALAIQFDKRLKEANLVSEKQRQEAAAAYVKEKEELRSEHQRQQREREASFDRVRSELDAKLWSCQKDHEDALRRERESREVWLAERETLVRSSHEDRESLRKSWDEQRDLLEAQYKKNKDESERGWVELHADATRKASEEKTKADQLAREREELQMNYTALRAESEKEKAIIKSVAANLESEKSRLEKMMECYGDIAEIKSKGDTY